MKQQKLPKSTVISILPYELNENKVGLYPGRFRIPAAIAQTPGDIRKPGILSVGYSVFYIPMAFGAQAMAAHSPAYEVARSIVNDYVTSLVNVSEDCRPGLFAVDEEYKNSDEAYEDLKNDLANYAVMQTRWFMQLINDADSEYKKYNNSNAIGDLHKVAARQLNQINKPWLATVESLQSTNCPACFAPVNPNQIICGSCRCVLNPEKYKTMQFAEVGVGAAQKVS